MATKNQLSRIHILKNKLGLADDVYRGMIATMFSGRASSKALNGLEAAKLAQHMAKLAGEPKRRDTRFESYESKWAALGTRPGMASPAQLAMIECIWDSLEATFWNKDGNGDRDKALNGFIKKRFESVERLRFLARDEAYKITEALKSIQRRNQGSGEGAGFKPARTGAAPAPIEGENQ